MAVTIERGLALASGGGLIVSLFLPLHRAPAPYADPLMVVDSGFTLVSFYPFAAVLLALVAACAIGLAAADRNRAVIVPALAAAIGLGLLGWSIKSAQANLATAPRLTDATKYTLDYMTTMLDFQWGWYALCASAAAMLLAGVLAWVD